MNLRNIRHRLPRLNRKQRVVRNLALAALCLLLLEWMLAFPALSRRGLLRRLEHRYLLEGSELLFTSTTADYGFDGYMAKPISAPQLRKQIAAILQKRIILL